MRRDDTPPPRRPNRPDGPSRGPRGPRDARGPGPARKPPLRVFTTTLWEYPSQHYGNAIQGDKNYAGATPSWVIWQCLQRYTKEKDLVIDPMAGSGTTLDVARDVKRRALGYDLTPSRPDIFRCDARKLPLEDAKADFVFIDPPYSTHIEYSDDPRDIGKLDAGDPPPVGEDADILPPKGRGGGGGARRSQRDVRGTGDRPGVRPPLPTEREGGRRAPARRPGEGATDSSEHYYDAMTKVIDEIHRVLRPGKHMALYVSDSFRKGHPFMPIGFELFSIMRERFEPVDIIAVVRHNQKLERGNWKAAAEEGNFFLRGFNYLFIMKKAAEVRGRVR